MNLEEVIQEAYDLGAKTLYDNPERTSHGTTVKYREQADKDVEQLVNKYDLLNRVITRLCPNCEHENTSEESCNKYTCKYCEGEPDTNW